MKDSKLIQLLKTFSKEEWKEFEKVFSIPYITKRKKLPAIFKMYS